VGEARQTAAQERHGHGQVNSWRCGGGGGGAFLLPLIFLLIFFFFNFFYKM
jgi:hypothetical protein